MKFILTAFIIFSLLNSPLVISEQTVESATDSPGFFKTIANWFKKIFSNDQMTSKKEGEANLMGEGYGGKI